MAERCCRVASSAAPLSNELFHNSSSAGLRGRLFLKHRTGAKYEGNTEHFSLVPKQWVQDHGMDESVDLCSNVSACGNGSTLCESFW